MARYVVLTERAMQMSLKDLLPHHNAELQARVLELSKLLLKRSSHHMDQFSKLWVQNGGEVSRAVRLTFPLTKSLLPAEPAEEKPGAEEAETSTAKETGAVSEG